MNEEDQSKPFDWTSGWYDWKTFHCAAALTWWRDKCAPNVCFGLDDKNGIESSENTFQRTKAQVKITEIKNT
jgi:hypothetical protein